MLSLNKIYLYIAVCDIYIHVHIERGHPYIMHIKKSFSDPPLLHSKHFLDPYAYIQISLFPPPWQISLSSPTLLSSSSTSLDGASVNRASIWWRSFTPSFLPPSRSNQFISIQLHTDWPTAGSLLSVALIIKIPIQNLLNLIPLPLMHT